MLRVVVLDRDFLSGSRIQIESFRMYNLEINGFKTELCALDNEVNFNISTKGSVSKVTIDIVDIIGVEDETKPVKSSNITQLSTVALHYINKTKSPKWMKSTYRFQGAQSDCSAFITDVKGKIESVQQRPRRLLVIVNPISGKKNGRSVFNKVVNPLFKLASITTQVVFTERANHITDIINEFDLSTVDGIVLLGGDGGYQECINTLLKRTQNEAGIDVNDPEVKLKPIQVPIGLIPTGTGNGVANFYYRCTDYVNAALHIIRGKRLKKSVAGAYCDGKLVSYFALVIGYGLFSDMMMDIDRQRWLGRARYLLGVINFFLLKTPRRFDVEVTVYSGLKHSVQLSEKTSTEETCEQNIPNEQEERLEIVNETLMNVGMWLPEITDDDFRFTPSFREDRCTLNLFKPCSKLQNAGYMKDFATQNPETFLRENLLNFKVTRWKLKIKNESDTENDFKNRHLDLDGEIFEIPKAEFEVR